MPSRWKARRSRLDAWLRGIDLERLEAPSRRLTRFPTSSNWMASPSWVARPAFGRARSRLAEDGAKRRQGRSRHHAGTGRVERFSGVGVEATQGLHVRAGSGRGEALPAVHLPQPRRLRAPAARVDYGITSNELVTPGTPGARSRATVQHPFIRRAMERCIACGRCVRVCRRCGRSRPATTFTGRGFTMNVDTPYGEALSSPNCISCGRCVSTCPTGGAPPSNERAISSFKLDESRCVTCNTLRRRLPGERARNDQPLFENARTKLARADRQRQRIGRRPPHVCRLRSPDRRPPGAAWAPATRL